MPSIEARIVSVEYDPTTEWYRIGTSHERVKRLDTKIGEKAREAAELKKSGELALIEYNERPSKNINPHNNRPYTDRYYERAGSIDQSDDGITTVAQTGRKTDPGDAWRISLAAGAKLAVATLPLMEQRSFEAQKQVAFAWAEFIYFTAPPQGPGMPAPEPPFGNTVAGGIGNGDAGGSDYVHGDDDIPFRTTI